jgi:hypothetical protein
MPLLEPDAQTELQASCIYVSGAITDIVILKNDFRSHKSEFTQDIRDDSYSLYVQGATTQ